MAEGYLGAQGGKLGLQWFTGFATQRVFGLVGEPIGEQGGEKMNWLSASRCSSCRLIVARY
jgi:hypothetical protein